VVGLIALLLAILLPSLQLARSHGQAVVCLSHLKQWGTTFALYTQENESRLPPTGHEGLWLMRGVLTTQGDANEPRVGRSIRTQGIACCPSAASLDKSATVGTMSLTAQNRTPILVTRGGARTAWEIIEPGPPFRGSYGLNRGLFLTSPLGYQSRIKLGLLGVDTLATKKTSRIPVLLDAPGPLGHPIWEMMPSGDGFDLSPGMPFCMKRHGTYVNGLFLDWSARRIDLKELWVLPWYPSFDTAGRWTKAGGVQPENWPKWLRGCKDY
jgi:prepilin-type processing-associated H-X9-DG protein